MNGTVTSSPGALVNDSDPGARFDGSTGYISGTNAHLNSTLTNHDFTIAFWGYWTGAQGSLAPKYAFSVGNGGATDTAIAFGWQNGNQLFFGFYSDDFYGTATNLSANVWHRCVLTFVAASKSWVMYLDGGQDNSGTSAGVPTIAAAAPFTIGRASYVADNYWPGSLDEVEVYDYRLSPAAVRADYQARINPGFLMPIAASTPPAGGTGAYGAGADGAGPYGGLTVGAVKDVPGRFRLNAQAWRDVQSRFRLVTGGTGAYGAGAYGAGPYGGLTVGVRDVQSRFRLTAAGDTGPGAAAGPAAGGPTIPSRPGYRYLFYDLVSNAPKGELELSGVRYSRVLNGAGSFRGTLALGDSRVVSKNPIGLTEPRRSRIYVERDGALVWGGIVWTRRWDDRSRALEIGAQEFWSYFQTRGSDTGRFVVDTLAWTQKDQLLIARDLVAYAQGQTLTAVDGGPKTFAKPGGNLGIQLSATTSGILRDRNYDATSYQEIGRAVEDLAAVDGGFDFSIDVAYAAGVPTASFVTSYPRRGLGVQAGLGLVFEKPGGVLGYSFPEDGTQFADTAYALGDGEGAAMLRSSSSRPDLIDAGSPLVEVRRSYKGSGINQQSTLDAHARADVAAAASAGAFPSVRVRARDPVPLGSYTTGDDVRLRITDERFPNPGYGGADQHLEAYFRIISYEVTVPSGSQDEEVTLTLGAVA